jgi:hypothetical protein
LNALQVKGKNNFREIKEYEKVLENGDVITSAVCFCDTLPGGNPYYNETTFAKRYGLKTKEGKILSPLYEMIAPWENNQYLVKYTEYHPDYMSEDWLALLDRNFKVKAVYPEDIRQEGTYRVKKGGKHGMISMPNLYEYIPFVYDSLSELSNQEEVEVMVKERSYRTLVAKKNGKYGFILSDNDSLIGFKYANADNFYRKIAVVELKNKWGIIDIYDSTVVPFAYDSIIRTGDDFYLYKNKKWGFMNYERQYKKVEFIYDGFLDGNFSYITFAKLQNKWYFLDDGKIKPGQEGFEEVFIDPNSGPYAGVRNGNSWAVYYCSKKKVITPFEYSKILDVLYEREWEGGTNYPVYRFKVIKDGKGTEFTFRD